MTQAQTPPILSFREVDRETWPDLERLFEARGGPKYCWCMAWREARGETRRGNSQARKTALKKRVDEGTPIGLLGYHDQEPVAWCSIAPRSTYRRLGGIEDETAENVWGLVCFFVPRRLRGLGIASQLIAAAVEYAQRNGATVIEAYPVDPDSPSYRFMGYVKWFKAAGFDEVGQAGARRHVMRKRIV